MDLAMVEVAERNGEFVADLATQCSRLSKPKMVSMAGFSPADQASKADHIAEVARVPKPLDLAAKQLAFIDPYARCGAGCSFLEWINIGPWWRRELFGRDRPIAVAGVAHLTDRVP